MKQKGTDRGQTAGTRALSLAAFTWLMWKKRCTLVVLGSFKCTVPWLIIFDKGNEPMNLGASCHFFMHRGRFLVDSQMLCKLWYSGAAMIGCLLVMGRIVKQGMTGTFPGQGHRGNVDLMLQRRKGRQLVTVDNMEKRQTRRGAWQGIVGEIPL